MNKPGQIRTNGHPGSQEQTPAKISLVTRIRFQLGGGLLVAIVLPLILRYQTLFVDHYPRDNVIQTLIGASLALIFGYFISRRFSNFPGEASRPYILVVYSVMFGITIAVFFMLRLEYIRYLFLVSYVVCLIWFVALHFSLRQLTKTALAIIPVGNTPELLKISGVEWTRLETPQMYDQTQGAIVVDLRADLSPEWERFIADSALQGISVYHSKQAQELLTGKVAIEHLSENNFGSLLPEMVYLRIKQAIDIVTTLVLLPFLLVIFAVVGVIIMVTSGRPVFYKQERTGYRGKRFVAYKFRTMVANDGNNEHHAAKGEAAQDRRNIAMTTADDKRITTFGKFLRKYRIDELPQIFNILKGEMGWIGPRPEAMALSLWYEEELPFYSYRHVVRPGITGWAQVNQGHVTGAEQVLEKLHYDFFYIKNLSIWLDLLIVLRTIRIVLLGIGAK